jgi:hypothetical protein
LFKGTPAKAIGEVEAATAEEAIEKAAQQFGIRDVDRGRLAARRVK